MYINVIPAESFCLELNYRRPQTHKPFHGFKIRQRLIIQDGNWSIAFSTTPSSATEYPLLLQLPENICQSMGHYKTSPMQSVISGHDTSQSGKTNRKQIKALVSVEPWPVSRSFRKLTRSSTWRLYVSAASNSPSGLHAENA